MTINEDKDVMAAEFVLGTLDDVEHETALAWIAGDQQFAARIEFWERKFNALTALVDEIEPSEAVWKQIEAAIGDSERSPTFHLPGVAVSVPVADVVDIAGWRQRAKGWRNAAIGTSALAASLVAFMVVREVQPDILPRPMQPMVRVVEKPAEGRFVAVLQKEPGSPAFLLTVDLAAQTLTARSVSAEQLAGKSYELWLVHDKFPQPRSLGVIGSEAFTVRPSLANYEPAIVREATYAVSLEPEGGSPTGVATGPVLFTGKLVQATP